ncbi:MAG: LacI family DNA-binding transcriptional regulator [Anaerolineae bacterium]|nr:LacI family DNA-binding transcriptional regulator [Anaerolineae bacterium]
MAVTLKDIARHVGVSVTTVSRALGGYDDVAETTRQKILRAAEELGYYPSVTARQLQKQRTDTIGFVIPTFGPRFSDPFFSELLAGIGNEAARHNFDLLVCTRSPDSPEEEEAYRRLVDGRRVDGMLVVRTRVDDPRLSFLKQRHFPFVAFGRSHADENSPYLDVDGHHGLYQAVRHLIDLGHRRIAYISAPLNLTFALHRLQGYRDALQEGGLKYDEELVHVGYLTEEDGYQAAHRLLALDRPPTAIAVANDLMALGAMRAAHERGLTVGRDVAITGFDDIPLAAHAHPPLTTVRQPIYEIGRRICQMLIQIITGEPLDNYHLILEPTLILRQSSGPAQ